MVNPLFSLVAAICLAVTPVQQPNHTAIQSELSKYSYAELGWGGTWEEVQRNLAIADEDMEQLEGADPFRVIVQNHTAFEKPVTIGFVFSTQDDTADIPVLSEVIIQYQQQDEAAVKGALTAQYGEPKSSYTDKNGVENPLEYPGWVSPTTMEQALTTQQLSTLREKEKDMEQTRFDAIVRQPLAVIMLDEENNRLFYRGSAAAYCLAAQK